MRVMIGGLYSPDILSLSATLRNERLEWPDGTARKVSKLCGSEVEIDVAMQDGRVSEAAFRVEACALGQASAAILYKNIVGADLAELQSARDTLFAILRSDALVPTGRFADIAQLAAVRGYPARHQSVMLAWEAAIAAVKAAA